MNDADRIVSFVELTGSSDEDAIEQGKRHGSLKRTRVEIWRGHEMIYRDPPGP